MMDVYKWVSQRPSCPPNTNPICSGFLQTKVRCCMFVYFEAHLNEFGCQKLCPLSGQLDHSCTVDEYRYLSREANDQMNVWLFGAGQAV